MPVFLMFFSSSIRWKECGLSQRPLFLMGVLHIIQKRRTWLRWVYNLGGGLSWPKNIWMRGFSIAFVFLSSVSKTHPWTSIYTRNFVTFYEFLMHTGTTPGEFWCGACFDSLLDSLALGAIWHDTHPALPCHIPQNTAFPLILNVGIWWCYLQFLWWWYCCNVPVFLVVGGLTPRVSSTISCLLCSWGRGRQVWLWRRKQQQNGCWHIR